MARTKEAKALYDNAYSQAYYAENKEAILIKRKQHYKDNKEALGVYRESTKETRAATAKAWKQNNKKLVNTYEARRRKLVRNYTMTEWDTFVMQEMYSLAQRRTDRTGVTYHVDHIIPIQHPYACGLNSAANLQVVPATWNLEKGNRTMDVYEG
jgi:hypothetical protein